MPEATRQGKRPGKGDRAPDFALPGTTVTEPGNREYKLSDLRGEPVVLVFYPADNSPVCTQQLRSYSEDLSGFTRLGAAVLCLSPQDVQTHEQFAAANALELPLLADTSKEVGRMYNVLGPLGFYRRSVFVIDGEGTITFARRSLTNMTFVPSEVLLEAVESTKV